jgi:flagellin
MSLFSVNTNLGALAALQSLDQTQQSLNEAQSQISTGQKVASASDNPAIYSIANTINSNIAGLSAVSDSLNFGAQVVATASAAVTNVNTVLQSLQQTVTSSNTTGESLTTLQSQVSAELTSINQYATSATFSGVNLLVQSAPTGGSNSLNVVQSVDGSVYSVTNQLNPTSSTTNKSLTDALGLTGLDVVTGAAAYTGTATPAQIGANIAFGKGTTVSNTTTKSKGTFLRQPGTSDAAVQITTGSGTSAKTLTFEFIDTNSATNGGNENILTPDSASNTTVAVTFDSSKDSTNQIVANLAAAITANGFGVVQQSDGSLNIVGNNLSKVSYGTATAVASPGPDTYASLSDTTGTGSTGVDGVTVSKLDSNQTAVTAVTSAVSKLNTIAANLGAASQQITGIQNFTTALSSALTAGVGALTDADLASESAQLTSLQTKQQLATQSLSIANQAPQNLLSLFKGA